MGLRAQVVALAGCAALWMPLALEGQSAQRVSLQASALFAGLFGKAYGGIGDGIGAEAQIRVTPGVLSIGAGVQLSRHSLASSSSGDDATLWGGFLEPRLRIPTGSTTVAPYLSARLSYLRFGLSSGSVTGTSGGATINGGGGLLIRLASRVNLDLGATYGYTDFGDLSLKNKGTGQIITTELGTGSNIVVRSGLTFGLF